MTRKKAGRKTVPKPSRFALSSVWLIPVLLVFGFLLYTNTLGHEFVFDDTTLIAQNPRITELRWGEIVSRSGYRPVRSLTYAFNYAVGGLEPFGYHLVNVLLHCLNIGLAYLLFLRLSNSLLASFAGGLLFACHPVQTAAVAYVSGRKDLLATFFLLIGTLLYLKFREGRGAKWLVAAVSACLLGVLSKEVVIVFPALFFVLDLYLRASTRNEVPFYDQLVQSLRKSPLVYLACSALALVALYYSIFMAQASRMEGLWGGEILRHIGTIFKLFAHYLRLALFPYPLVADYTGDVFQLSNGFSELSTIASVLVLVGYVAVAVFIFPRRRLFALGMFWFLIALAPVLQVVPFHEIAADHFLYLPMIGVALMTAALFEYLTTEKKLDIVAWGLLAIVVALSSLLTVDRNRDWKNAQTLWESTYAVAPGSFRANMNLGLIYYIQGDWRKGIRLTEKAIELGPGESLPYANLGAILRERGFTASVDGDLGRAKELETEAIGYLEEAIRLDRSNPFNHSNLGDAYKDMALLVEEEGDVQEGRVLRRKALHSFRRAMKIGSENPQFPLVWFKYGSTLVDSGNCKDAIPYLENAANRLGERYDVQNLAGFCHFVVGSYPDSAHYLERALKVWPDNEGLREQLEEAFLLLGQSYQNLGQAADAVRIFTAMLRVFPDSVEAHYSLGVVSREVGNIPLAVRHAERALELEPAGPRSPDIRALLGQLRREGAR